MPDKYLERYASDEIALADDIDGCWDNAVVIPAHDETAALIDGIRPAAAGRRVLVIIVVNATADAPAPVRRANEQLLHQLGELPATDELHVLAIDRTSPGNTLPANHGVGMARRIGCDLALALRHAGKLRSRWIHTTDADVTLPPDYFSAADAVTAANVTALTYAFWHDADTTTEGRALALYELSLRYYVRGLQWAGSDYGFHTVGSTLAVDATAYAKVRGVPLRCAGEDFYLLNKLAKLGRIHTPAAPAIRIRQRPSARVPFGTGPATRAIAADLTAGRAFCVYHPHIFELLRRSLEVARDAATAGSECTPAAIDGDRSALRAAWQRTQLTAGVAHVCANATTTDARIRRFREWFDGFRTLAFVHAARDAGLANMSWERAFDQAPFIPPSGELETFRQRLLRLEHERE